MSSKAALQIKVVCSFSGARGCQPGAEVTVWLRREKDSVIDLLLKEGGELAARLGSWQTLCPSGKYNSRLRCGLKNKVDVREHATKATIRIAFFMCFLNLSALSLLLSEVIGLLCRLLASFPNVPPPPKEPNSLYVLMYLDMSWFKSGQVYRS